MSSKTGLWLIGAQGGIGTVLTVGLEALKRGLTRPFGLLTESPEFRDERLWPAFEELVVGGHEVRHTTYLASARELLAKSRIFSESLLEDVAKDLRETDARIRAGILWRSGRLVEDFAASGSRPSRGARPVQLVERIIRDLQAFRQRTGVKQLVVVNVASTEEPPAASLRRVESLESFERQLGQARCPFPASVLYAYSALRAGAHYVNFTPSVGSDLPPLHRLAERQGVLHMGRDGKTGETLLKTALAPLFRWRHLPVLSWAGYNMLGDRDGLVLKDPKVKRAKTKTKGDVLGRVLGYEPHTVVGIDYVPSLHEWKTAWDFVHFQGFLETRMSLQFTWQGCDAVLAAPLVLDLARLTAAAADRGEAGLMPWLACFFKEPAGTAPTPGGFVEEVAALKAHLETWKGGVHAHH